MSTLHKLLLAASVALSCGVSRADTIPLTFNVGTNSHWGNLTVDLVPSFTGTLTYDFWWSGFPTPGSVFVGGRVQGSSPGIVSFANMALWQCGPIDCNTVTPVTLGGVSTTHQPFNGNPTDVVSKYYIDPVQLGEGHYLFSFDVKNTLDTPVQLTAMAGVFPIAPPPAPPLQPGAVSPVPEPGTWALMLAGLAAVAWAARRRLPAGMDGNRPRSQPA